jgi:hypothetical protein
MPASYIRIQIDFEMAPDGGSVSASCLEEAADKGKETDMMNPREAGARALQTVYVVVVDKGGLGKPPPVVCQRLEDAERVPDYWAGQIVGTEVSQRVEWHPSVYDEEDRQNPIRVGYQGLVAWLIYGMPVLEPGPSAELLLGKWSE